MKWIKILLGVILVVVFGFASFVGIMTFIDEKPDEVMGIPIVNNQVRTVPLNEELIIATYNIGYGGLGQEQDFFADGGTRSRAFSEEEIMSNLQSMVEVLDSTNSNFMLLQEVDKKASRSYKINQIEFIKNLYPNYSYSFGRNYNVKWVPVPLFNPMGSVESGLLTLSKYNAYDANRFQFPGGEKWPVQIFELDRCFVETRFNTIGDKDLILINLHLSAFDEGGLIREQQLLYLKTHIENEHEKGNYIIVGGDWNHNLPGSDPSKFTTNEEWPFWLKDLPENFYIEGFSWIIDNSTPTVRTLEKNYVEGENFRAVIDGFYVSDNLEITGISGIDTNFVYADHNPVVMSFKLIQ